MADKNHIFSHLSLSTTDRSPSVCLIVVFFHLPEVVFTSIPERLWWRGISVLAMTWQFVMVKWNTPCKNRILSHPNWCSSVFLTFCRQQYYWNWMEQIMKCGETWVPESLTYKMHPTRLDSTPRQTLEAKKVEFQTATQIAEATCDLFLLHLRPAATSSSLLKNVMEIIGWYKCGSSIGFSRGYFSICSIHPGHLLCWIVKRDVVRRRPTSLSRRLCGSILVVNINN